MTDEKDLPDDDWAFRESPAIEDLDDDLAFQAERFAWALVATMMGDFRRCKRRSCRQAARCMSVADNTICMVDRPNWANDMARALRRFAYGFKR